jgi:hypothetical protein
LTIEHDGKLLPWYCRGFEEEWLSLNPYERCVRTGISLLKRSIEQQKRALHPERILTLQFEKFVEDTEIELERVCNFLGTKQTDQTPIQLVKARCPRHLDINNRANKMAELKKNIRSEIFADLLSVSEEYENGLFGLD